MQYVNELNFKRVFYAKFNATNINFSQGTNTNFHLAFLQLLKSVSANAIHGGTSLTLADRGLKVNSKMHF